MSLETLLSYVKDKDGYPMPKSSGVDYLIPRHKLESDDNIYYRDFEIGQRMKAFYAGFSRQIPFINSFYKDETQTPGYIAAVKSHPAITMMGAVAGNIPVVGAASMATSGVASGTIKAIPEFIKILNPTAARVAAGVMHSAATGFVVGAAHEAGRQMDEKDIHPLTLAKEAAWQGLEFAPWGIVGGTKIGAKDSILMGNIKKGLAAAGTVAGGTSLVTLMRKHNVTDEDLLNIGVNSITAGILAGFHGARTSKLLNAQDLRDISFKWAKAKIKAKNPELRDEIVNYLAEISVGEMHKSPYQVINELRAGAPSEKRMKDILARSKEFKAGEVKPAAGVEDVYKKIINEAGARYEGLQELPAGKNIVFTDSLEGMQTTISIPVEKFSPALVKSELAKSREKFIKGKPTREMAKNAIAGEFSADDISLMINLPEGGRLEEIPEFKNTEQAYAYGDTIRDNKIQIANMVKQRAENQVRIDELKKSDKFEDLVEQGKLVAQNQFIKEAVQYSLGTAKDAKAGPEEEPTKTAGEPGAAQASAALRNKYKTAIDFIRAKGLDESSVEIIDNENFIVSNAAGNEALLTEIPLSDFGQPKFETLSQKKYKPGQKITDPIEVSVVNGEYRITDGANRFMQAVANKDKMIPVILENYQEMQFQSISPEKGTSDHGAAFALDKDGMEVWKKRQEETKSFGMEMPELVKLFKDLLDRAPYVKKLGVKYGGLKLGEFAHRGDKGWVNLSTEIFKNPRLAAATLAHEMGHMIDWLPDFCMERGNILGRLASFKGYLKILLPERPGGEEILTEEDRIRFKKEARKQLKEEMGLGEREIIEEVIKEIPIYADLKITADDILSIWRDAATSMRETNPELYFYIAGLSPREKESIIRQALKGIVDARLVDMFKGKKVGVKIVREFVKKIIQPEEPSEKNIAKRFRKLWTAEVKKRKLYQEEVIQKELVRATQYWNPFDDTRNPKYTRYRYSSVELYAEAISMLLNDPDKLKELAPEFYRGFFNYLENKPKVKAAYADLMDLLAGKNGEIFADREKRILDMFTRGEAIRRQKFNEKQLRKVNTWEMLRQALDDKYYLINKKTQDLERKGIILKPEDNPKRLFEELSFATSESKIFIYDVDQNVLAPLAKEGIDRYDFGQFLFLKRIVNKKVDYGFNIEGFDAEELNLADRRGLANPLGFDPKTAEAQLEYLKQQLGPEKYKKIEEAADKFHKLIFAVVEEAVKVGSYNLKIFNEKILPNKDYYVTFGVLNYLQNFVPAGIKFQKGTLSEIENPLITTLLKTVSLIHLNNRQRAMNSWRDMMKTYFSDEISLSRHIQKDSMRVWIDSPGKGRVEMMEDGRRVSYDVDPYLAQSFKYDSPLIMQLAGLTNRIFLNRIFKDLFITYNPGFGFIFNPVRDFRNSYKTFAALKKPVSVRELLIQILKDLPKARDFQKGKFEGIVREMMNNKALDVPFIGFQADLHGDPYSDVLQSVTGNTADKQRKGILKFIMPALDFVKFHGSSLETVTKIAGYNLLKAKGFTDKDAGYYTRNFIGTPNYRISGKITSLTNSVWMFSNIFKEGIKNHAYLASNPKTRSGYWWATLKNDLVPKLLMYLAGAGLFGAVVKRWMDQVPEYDKTNYTILPIPFVWEYNGKPIYIRIPHDEQGRMLAGIFWKVANAATKGKVENLLQVIDYGAGQLPDVAPGIDLLKQWGLFLSGKNPYDSFRGRYLISDQAWRAGGWPAIKKMVQWTINNAGLTSIATYDDASDTTLETIIKSTPGIDRVIRISDYGLKEAAIIERRQEEKQRSREALKLKDMAKNAALEYRKTPTRDLIKRMAAEISDEETISKKDYTRAREYLGKQVFMNNVYTSLSKIFISAVSNEEKIKILKQLKDELSPEEYQKAIKIIQEFHLASGLVISKANQK